MAKLSSTARPASRGSQADVSHPATAPAPARTQRSTRSQSRETSAQPEERPTRSDSLKKRAGRKPKQNDLTAVPEAIDEDHLQAQALATEQEAAAAALAGNDDDVEPPRRESAHSGISGTTAKTSFSQEEIADLDRDIIVDVLSNFASAAEQMTDLLVPPNPQMRPVVWKEIRVQGSKQNKLYRIREDSLSVHKDKFGSQEYVQPSIVLRALFDVETVEEIPDGPWRPDDIIYKINLAQMLRTTIITTSATNELTNAGFEAFQLLEAHFPVAIAGPKYDRQAVRLCVALQTQLAIACLHAYMHDPQYDPASQVNRAFFREDNEGDMIYKDVDALHMPLDGKARELWATEIAQTADALKVPFDQGLPAEEALAQLRSTYTWNSFIDQVLHYYEHRNLQLNERIVAAGGSNQIISSLSHEVERRGDTKLANEKRKSFGMAATPQKSFGKGAITALKAREQRLSATAPPPAVTQLAAQAPVAQMMDPRLTQQHPPQAAIAPHDDWAPQLEDDNFGQPTAQQRAVSALELSGFQNQQRQNARKGKGRAAFVEQEPDAQRDGFQNSQPGQQPAGSAQFQMPGRSSAPGPYHVSSSRSPGKRTHAEANEPQEFEPTQDEGFQQDMRNPALADARRRTAPVPQRQRPQPVPASSSHTVDYELPASASATSSPAKRRRKNPGSTIPSMPPPDENDAAIPAGSYKHARVLAKQGRITASQNKPPQVRTPWSEEEDNALISLIENYGGDGVSYAALKKHAEQIEGQPLHRRSAEDLRFKARNMKLTFLCARVELPENWDHIVLDRKAKDKLHDRGIAYYQQPIRAVNHEAPGA